MKINNLGKIMLIGIILSLMAYKYIKKKTRNRKSLSKNNKAYLALFIAAIPNLLSICVFAIPNFIDYAFRTDSNTMDTFTVLGLGLNIIITIFFLAYSKKLCTNKGATIAIVIAYLLVTMIIPMYIAKEEFISFSDNVDTYGVSYINYLNAYFMPIWFQ
jgi:uncharacterized membrane protein YadS